MEPKLSKYLAGFRRNHNTQHALLRMIESWRALQNKGQKVGAIIMDLSKAFDTLNHKLLFKKLQAYGFDKKSLSFIESYFTNRKQRTKIGDSFSKYQRIITGVPQGSILGSLFFHIFINDLFLIVKNVSMEKFLPGDTNGNYCVKSCHNKIKELFIFHGVHQLNELPTRVTQEAKSLIDVIMTNTRSNVQHIELLPSSLNDHDCVMSARKINHQKNAV